MVSSRPRVAFIGAGKQANWRHYPSVASQPDVELAALCDLIPEKAEETAQRWEVPQVYQDYKKMLDEVDPEAVYIIMPPQDVFEPTRYALSQGRNVFIEKPPSVTLNGIKLLAHYAELNDCTTMVGFQRRHVPAMTTLKARVEERGPIHAVTVANLKSTRDFSQHTGGAGLLDMFTSDGMHSVDNLRWLGGGDILRLTSSVRTVYTPGPVANHIMAQVEFSSGIIGQLHYSAVSGGAAIVPGATAAGFFRTEVFGKNITATVDADRESSLVADSGEMEVFDAKAFSQDVGSNPEHYLGFWHQHRYFIDCLKAGEQPNSHFGDAVKTWELIQQIYDAAPDW